MKIKTFLTASVAALALYAAPSLAQDTVKDKDLEVKLQKAIKKGEAAFKFSGKRGLARLTVKIGNVRYDMNDGCLPFQGLGECKLDDKPDICAVYDNNVIKQNLWGQEKAEPVCGDIYRKTKDEFIDYHVEKFKELVKKEGTAMILFAERDGPSKAAVVDRYVVYDGDGDGVVETFLLRPKNPLFPKFFISENTSKAIEEKIGGLYKFVDNYMKKKTKKE